MLSQSLLGTLSFALQLQKATTGKYQRSLLTGWPRAGFLSKPDFKKSEIETWGAYNWVGKYNRRHFVLDGAELRYYYPKDAQKGDAKPLLSAHLLVAPPEAAVRHPARLRNVCSRYAIRCAARTESFLTRPPYARDRATAFSRGSCP